MLDQLAILATGACERRARDDASLGQIYAYAGCLLALDRLADARPFADYLISAPIAATEWGDAHAWYIHAVRARVLAACGEKAEAAKARKKLGPSYAGTPAQIAKRWADSVRWYRAEVARVRALAALPRLVETGQIYAHLVRALLLAPADVTPKLQKLADELLLLVG